MVEYHILNPAILPFGGRAMSDLNHFSAEQWKYWLAGGVDSYIAACNAGERGDAVSAFAPLVANGDYLLCEGPENLSRDLRSYSTPVLDLVRDSIAQLLKDWRPEQGIGRATFLLGLPRYLANGDAPNSNMADAIRSVLSQPIPAFDPANSSFDLGSSRDWNSNVSFSDAMAAAIVTTTTPAEARAFLRPMRDLGMREGAIVLTLAHCIKDGTGDPFQDFRDLYPDWPNDMQRPWAGFDYLEYELRKNLPAERYEALTAPDTRSEAASDLLRIRASAPPSRIRTPEPTL